MNSNLLRSVLLEESRAYGFTIAFWGSGALLINRFGIPHLGEVLSYAGGAVLGFGLLTIWVYRRPLSPAETEETRYLAISMVHYLAAIVPIVATSFLTQLDPGIAFFISGASVSVLYNILMVVEEWISEKIEAVERAFLEG